MKRAGIVIGTLLICSLAASGQFIRSYGFKGGLSLANQSHQFTPFDYTIETDPVTGHGFAIFMETFRREHWSLQLDLAYVVKGSKTSTESVTINHLDNDNIVVNKGDLHISRFSYLSLSPLARFRFGGERFTPYLFLGLRLDMLLRYYTDSDYPLDEQNTFIPGVSMGGGLEYALNRNSIFSEIQFQGDAIPVTGIDPLLINNHAVLIAFGVRLLNIL